MPSASNNQPIVWRLHLRSSPDKVYEMLATDGGRQQFWAESARETAGIIDFHFINGVRTRGFIVDRRPPHRIEFDYFDSRVVFDLASDGGSGTDLTLTNTDFDPDEYYEILPGWLNVLFPLKAAVDFGIDLRSHDASRTWERRFIDQ